MFPLGTELMASWTDVKSPLPLRSTLIVILVPIFSVNRGESMTVCADRPLAKPGKQIAATAAKMAAKAARWCIGPAEIPQGMFFTRVEAGLMLLIRGDCRSSLERLLKDFFSMQFVRKVKLGVHKLAESVGWKLK